MFAVGAVFVGAEFFGAVVGPLVLLDLDVVLVGVLGVVVGVVVGAAASFAGH